jgi:hypothetical protein
MNTDIIAMIGNLSRTLFSVQALITGLGYILGLMLMFKALMILKEIGDRRTNSSSQDSLFLPLVHFLAGAALIFLPSMVKTLSVTAFGTGNILEYVPYNPYKIQNSLGILIQTSGVIWFVRGTMLLVHGSEPGAKEGPKGLTFVLAGILAMNFQATYGGLNYIMNHFILLVG